MAATMDGDAAVRERRHILQDLGWEIARAGDERHGQASVVAEMHAPGTPHLRTSILAAWADVVAGYLAVDSIGPRVPVTLELDVHLYRPAPSSGTVSGAARIVKAGRSVFVAEVDFSDHDGQEFGFAAASFMPAPDERLSITALSESANPVAPTRSRLTVPFAERAGCARVAPGVAEFPHSDDKLNASNTVNGGLIALAVEEALLSLAPNGASVSSLDMRYLQPARVGPVVARADVRDGLGRVQVRDEGNDNRLCVVATGRFFGL